MGKDKNIGDDYVLDLLNNRKRYEIQIHMIENYQHYYHDQYEFEELMTIKKHLALLDECMNYLDPMQQVIIKNIYTKQLSLREVGKKLNMSKTSVDYQKKQAIEFIKSLLPDDFDKN